MHKVQMIRDILCGNNNSTWMRYLTMNCSVTNKWVILFTMHKTYDYVKPNLILNSKSLHKRLTTLIYEKDYWHVNFHDVMWLNWMCIDLNQWRIEIRFMQNKQSQTYGN